MRPLLALAALGVFLVPASGQTQLGPDDIQAGTYVIDTNETLVRYPISAWANLFQSSATRPQSRSVPRSRESRTRRIEPLRAMLNCPIGASGDARP
jgi:hypothetical protein